ncbi:unnamed protein product [Hyaloperonospora brassicae]|uniref:RxLR effector candidate protein n=1 Tax=Hyaloperonospora brassicae TaxID=162125 RepID=A0AAV0V1D6_HYABA|nr:unnamed protein product [Hyaloperonospora brassicae]
MATKMIQGWEDMKSFMVLEFGGINGHKLTPASWSRVMDETKQILERVPELERNAYTTEIEAISKTRGEQVATLRRYQLAEDIERTYLSTTAVDIITWMDKKPQGDAVKVLTQNGFFQEFSCAKVKALEMCFKRSDDAFLFDTLSEGFGGTDKFASLLSSAKLGPFTRHEAASYQHRLLASWHVQGRTEGGGLVDLLKLKTNPLTYETLDTLVEYIALNGGKEKLTPDRACSKTILYLRTWLGDGAVVRAIRDGKMDVKSATWHLRDRYNDKDIALINDDDESYMNEFENELMAHFFIDKLHPSAFQTNPFHHTEAYSNQFHEDYTAFYNRNKELWGLTRR